MQWNEVEPVLRAVYALLDHDEQVTPQQVAEQLGRDDDEWLDRALGLLEEWDYIGGISVDQRRSPIFISATEKGLQRASGWPRDGAGDLAEALLRLFDERAADPATPEPERGKLRQARELLGSLPRDLLVEVMAAYTTRVLPGAD